LEIRTIFIAPMMLRPVNPATDVPLIFAHPNRTKKRISAHGTKLNQALRSIVGPLS